MIFYQAVKVLRDSLLILDGSSRRMKRRYLSPCWMNNRPTLTQMHRIGAETCDLLDKLLTCNPRERLTASQALDHDYFWTDPLPADPKTWAPALLLILLSPLQTVTYSSLFRLDTLSLVYLLYTLLSEFLPICTCSLPTYEASHEFDKRGRRHQPAGPPVQPPHIEHPSRPIPAPTQPVVPRVRPPLPGPPNMPPYAHSYPHPHHLLPPPGTVPPPAAPPMPQALPPLSLRPGQPLPPQWQQPVNLPLPPRPGHLPPRPGGGRGGGRESRDYRGRRSGGGNVGGGLNYG